MLQRYTFYHIKYVLDKKYFYVYNYHKIKHLSIPHIKICVRTQDFAHKISRVFGKMFQKQKTATLGNMAVKQKQQKINKLQLILFITC